MFLSYSSWFRPEGRGTFSCVPKRKYPKRRAPGALIGCADPLRSSPIRGGAHNSEFNGAGKPAPLNLPQTGRAPVPGLAAVLGECNGARGGTPFPLAQPSIAGILRASEPPCRAGFASRRRGKCCEFGERSKSREAQGTRVAGKPSGRVSFGYFSLAEQRKVPRPRGAKP